MMKFLRSILSFLMLSLALPLYAQDSISVYFHYQPTATALRAFLPGEFNGWGPNTAGRIATNAVSKMDDPDFFVPFYSKTLRLREGGGTGSTPQGTGYQYKMHEQYNGDGSNWAWFSDPANPLRFSNDQNSVVIVRHPMIFQLEPGNNKVIQGTDTYLAATLAARNNDRINIDSSKIFLNGVDLGSLRPYYDSTKQFFYVSSLSSSFSGRTLLNGTNKLLVRAVTFSGAVREDSSTFSAIVATPVDEPRPAGIVEGINYINSTTVTLCLFAPYKKFVHAIGDFNNWEVQPSFLMKRDSLKADSVFYWITLTGLTPGQEYAFQYLVDGNLRIADPYTEKILDPFDDQFIPSATYPNLKAYPSGKTSFQVSVFQTNQTPYQWNVPNFQRPDKRDLVIYEMLVRDFISARNFQTLIDTLGYLQRLGVNCIELMPINEFEGNSSWGYNPSFFFAADKYYGTKNNLKRFIDTCHARGIAVVVDMVLNHQFGQSPLVRLYSSGDYGPPTDDNLWFNRIARHPFNVGYDMNHESKFTRAFVKRVNDFWLNEFKIDGFRFDLSKGFTQVNSGSNVGLWGQYDASRIAIWKRIYNEIQATAPGAYVILEHLSENQEETELANFGLMFWGKLVNNYNESTMGYHENNKSDLNWGYFANRGWSQNNLVTIIEDHDEERLMVKNIKFGAQNLSVGYSTRNLNTSLDRIKAAGAFFFTIPGPKMFWQFGELGYDFSINYPTDTENSRLAEKPIRWDYFNNVARQNLYKTYAALIKLKKENLAFREGTASMSTSGGMKRIKITHNEMNVTVIGNFLVNTSTIQPLFHNAGVWYNYMKGDSIVVSNTDTIMTLQAGEFRIYTSKKLPTPDQGIDVALSVGLDSRAIPRAFALEQNYPNPFNPSTSIRYSIPTAGEVSLKVFDILGREISTLATGRHDAGTFQVNFNAASLSTGVYFYRLTSGSFSQTRKMLLVK
ncbi:MAG: alpha-amylase family glycosyl hydrolase [Chloroherpetonaceae bacterium]|nr:alpha-amylase family glycosyl hydrolase [Chloroherpetonaceae bacterium]